MDERKVVLTLGELFTVMVDDILEGLTVLELVLGHLGWKIYGTTSWPFGQVMGCSDIQLSLFLVLVRYKLIDI